MASVTAISRQVEVLRGEDKPNVWANVPLDKRVAAEQRAQLLQHVFDRVQRGAPIKSVARLLSTLLECEQIDPELLDIARRQSKRGKLPSAKTLERWLSAYKKDGVLGLVDNYTGRVRKSYGWETRAIAMYNKPSKPAMAAVADWLQDEGHESATQSRVRAFLKSLPSDLGEYGKGRIGAHKYRQDIGPYIERDASVLPVGLLYMGDGHTIDDYLQHPATGKAFRPELTLWLDVASRYVTAWYLSEAESARSTLFALSKAMLDHDHVPALVYVDPGPGFSARMMNDDVTGFLQRFAIDPIYALPGNAKGKGNVERIFRTIRDKHDKKFDTYCGDDMAPEINRRLSDQIKQGKRTLPTLKQYADSLTQFIERYNNTPHRGLNGATPASVWADLERTPVETPQAAVIRPSSTATVQRRRVRLHNRIYSAPTLEHYNRERVRVEYDLHDDRQVWIYDAKGVWICDAHLQEKRAYLPESRIEEAQQKRLRGQIERKQRHIEEDKARAGLAIGHEDHLESLDRMGALEADDAPEHLNAHDRDAIDWDIEKEADLIEIDPLDTSYGDDAEYDDPSYDQ